MDTLQIPGFDTRSTQLAQELYDPAKRLNSDPDLVHVREVFGAFILDLYGISSAEPEALLPALVCDAVESALDTEESLLERTEGTPNARELITPSVEELVGRAQEHAADILEQIDIEGIPREKRTVYAADRVARAAYDGKVRKTGEQYYEHPKRAAAMALHIFGQLEEEGHSIESQFKDAVICAALLHDATEETIRSCKYYNPDRPKGFSPLLVREIFRQTENPHGHTVANSLRLMTHYAKHEWAPDYETYVNIGSDDFVFDLVKTLDMGDNLLHPKPITASMDSKAVEKITSKRTLYTRLIGTMAVKAEQHASSTDSQPWAARYFKIFHDIDLDDMPAMIEELNLYIYGRKEEPAYVSTGLRPGSPVTELTFPAAA